MALAGWLWARGGREPQERERRRRLMIEAQGRLIEGEIVDVREGVLYFRYIWRGVDYIASQDVSELPPLEPDSIIGPVTVKFLPRDPSNSIVYSEGWSGFGRRARPAS